MTIQFLYLNDDLPYRQRLYEEYSCAINIHIKPTQRTPRRKITNCGSNIYNPCSPYSRLAFARGFTHMYVGYRGNHFLD